MMALVLSIPLTQGYEAMIDATSYDMIKLHRWCARVKSHTCYAKTNVRCAEAKSGFKMLLMHRYLLGDAPSETAEVDHIDRNGLNNCLSNLRWVDKSTNGRNRRSWSKTGFKGVYLLDDGRYQASLKEGAKTIYLGIHGTAIEAAFAFDAEAKKRYGSDCLLNFPEPTERELNGES